MTTLKQYFKVGGTSQSTLTSAGTGTLLQQNADFEQTHTHTHDPDGSHLHGNEVTLTNGHGAGGAPGPLEQ